MVLKVRTAAPHCWRCPLAVRPCRFRPIGNRVHRVQPVGGCAFSQGRSQHGTRPLEEQLWLKRIHYDLDRDWFQVISAQKLGAIRVRQPPFRSFRGEGPRGLSAPPAFLPDGDGATFGWLTHPRIRPRRPMTMETTVPTRGTCSKAGPAGQGRHMPCPAGGTRTLGGTQGGRNGAESGRTVFQNRRSGHEVARHRFLGSGFVP